MRDETFPRTFGSEAREEERLQREVDEILQEVGQSREDDPDFVDWYLELRRRYGKPTDDAKDFLLQGDLRDVRADDERGTLTSPCS